MTEIPARLSTALSGRYRLERELGAGGMATVYLAADLRHDRKVAIKVLKPDLAAVLGAERFVTEIKTTAALQHPHILPLFDSGEADGFLYYVMPFIDGETLRAKLDRESQLGIDESVRIASDVASALHYAHQHGVIHRDIKPENILLHDGRPMVADFGIALALSAAAGGRMTETGLSLGTPHYMSPEQATAEREITGRSDIYSLGCVLYEMLAGDPPHTGSIAQQIIMKIITEAPPPLAARRRSVPPHVAAAVEVALEKLPADRWESAKEFAEALVEGQPAARRASSRGAATTSRPDRRFPVRLLVVAVALAGTAGLLAWLMRGDAVHTGLPMHVQIDPRPAPGFGRSPQHAFTFTPDGRAIVFAVGQGDAHRLYRRQLDQSESAPLAGTEGAANPFVSPDGQWIGFWADGALRRVPMAGGAVQTLYDLRAAAATDAVAWEPSAQAMVYGAVWLPTDTIIYGRFSGGLRAIPVDGGPARALTGPDSGDVAHRLPRALPGGRAILFTVVRSLLADYAHVEALVLSTGERRRLLDDAADARYDGSGYLLFARAGALHAVRFDPSALEVRGEPFRVLPDVMHAVQGNAPGAASGAAQFDIAPDGTLAFLPGGAWPTISNALAWVAPGGRMDTVRTEPSRYTAPRLSPDGRRIGVTTSSPGGDFTLRLMDLERGISTVVARDAVFALWAPDGSRLFAVRRAEGSQHIYAFRLDGGDPERVAGGRYPLWPGSVSADGRWLAFVESNPATGNDIWIMDLEAGGSARPLLNTAAGETHPAISPDGRWLAYASDESGVPEVYVRPFDGTGRPERISRGGGTVPSWAPDGRTVYYIGLVDRSILAVAVETAGGLRIGRTDMFAAGRFLVTTPVGAMDLAPDGRLLMVLGAASMSIPVAPVPLHVIVNGRALFAR